ncbi:MAG: PepSY-associated TM helix domain-containing protein [Gammaproteobacteria bacterium]|nr:PepSY-associated TM helix domain-containing protein [Gammaproteobacteria bacterium]
MNRRFIISLHLYLASFFAPVLLVMATSGLFYLLDMKGNVNASVIYEGDAKGLDLGEATSGDKVREWFESNNVDYSFEYLRGNGSWAVSRPTSQTHYLLSVEADKLTVTKRSPDFIYSIIELHKGHGPLWFRYFQHFMAVGLLFIVLSGFYLGITSPVLKKPTWTVTGAGLISLIVLALI